MPPDSKPKIVLTQAGLWFYAEIKELNIVEKGRDRYFALGEAVYSANKADSNYSRYVEDYDVVDETTK